MPYMSNNLRRASWLLLGALLSLTALSCAPARPRGLELPPTPSIFGDPGWLVVKAAYATLKSRPGAASPDAGHLRDGLVLPIKGRAFALAADGESSILWYLVSSTEGSGWVSSADCESFASEEQARRSLPSPSP